MEILQPLLPAPRLSQPPCQLFLIPATGTRGELCPVGRQLAAPAGSEADLAELFAEAAQECSCSPTPCSAADSKLSR